MSFKAKLNNKGLEVYTKYGEITVEGTTEKVIGIKDPFTDERGFTNAACADFMMAIAGKMLDYMGTCYYAKYKGIGFVLTDRMFEKIED